MNYLFHLTLIFILFFNLILPSNQEGQVIPPGSYQIIVWTKLNRSTDCEDFFVETANGQSFLTIDALRDNVSSCFDQFKEIITDENGIIDEGNIVFYGEGNSFCDLKHTFNIHLMPISTQSSKNRLFQSEDYPECPEQSVKSKGKKNNKEHLVKLKRKKSMNAFKSMFASKSDDDYKRCEVHYHENKLDYLDSFFKRWNTGAIVRQIDVFMAKAYLQYFLSNEAELEVMQRFSRELKSANLLAMFERWVDGEAWLDDMFNLFIDFQNLISDVMAQQEVDTKTNELIVQIGLILAKGLEKTKMPNALDQYVPNFVWAGNTLNQICILITTNRIQIAYDMTYANSAWHIVCAEFFEEMWQLWFHENHINIKVETEDPPKVLDFGVNPDPLILNVVFHELIDDLQHNPSIKLTKQKMMVINGIGNVFDRALQVNPAKTLKLTYEFNVHQTIATYCEQQRLFAVKSASNSVWRLICNVFQWGEWLNSPEEHELAYLSKLECQLLRMVGDIKTNNWDTMDLEDKFVLDRIGLILMEKVFDDKGAAFSKFFKIAGSTICKICVYRSSQFYGWDDICVYNMWLLKAIPDTFNLAALTRLSLILGQNDGGCKEIDKKSIATFVALINLALQCYSETEKKEQERITQMPREDALRMLHQIGTMLKQNLNSRKNWLHLDELLLQTKHSLTIFCMVVKKTQKFFATWIFACEKLMLDEVRSQESTEMPTKVPKNGTSKNKTPKKATRKNEIKKSTEQQTKETRKTVNKKMTKT